MSSLTVCTAKRDEVIDRTEISRHVGAHLSGRRIERALSVAMVADLAGISRQALGAMERGLVMPSLATLYNLAEAMNCEPSDLLPKRKAIG